MDVGQRSKELVDVQLDLEDRHRSLHLVEVSRSSVDGLWDVLEDEIEVDFIFLFWSISISVDTQA
jgi:hypothetical protein